jgi:hypothetical protein
VCGAAEANRNSKRLLPQEALGCIRREQLRKAQHGHQILFVSRESGLRRWKRRRRRVSCFSPVAQCARVHLFVTLYLSRALCVETTNFHSPGLSLQQQRDCTANFAAARRLFATHTRIALFKLRGAGKKSTYNCARAPAQNGINLKQRYLDKRVVREVRRKKLAHTHTHTYEKHFSATKPGNAI